MRGKFHRALSLALVLAASSLAWACDTGPSPNATPTPTPSAGATPASTPGESPSSTPDGGLTKVTIALGYIPDVQFAPFYVALNKGYYKEQGLDVTLRNGIVPDLIKELGAGENGVNFAAVSGDEVIPARLQNIPVKYVMTWFRQYPVAAVSIEGKGPTLRSPSDLKGRKVGVPGPFGSSYVGLVALLKAGGLTQDDIDLESIGFTQVASLTAGQVDVAIVYVANEPTQLKGQGVAVSTLRVSDYARLASNGLATNEKTLREDPTLVSKVVRATLRGIQDTIDDPEAAFELCLRQVPEAGGKNKDLQMQVLKETIKLMLPNPNDPSAGASAVYPTPGWVDEGVWVATQDLLFDAQLITRKGQVKEMFTNEFVQLPPR